VLRRTFPTLLDLIVLTVYSDNYNQWSSSQCIPIRLPFTFKCALPHGSQTNLQGPHTIKANIKFCIAVSKVLVRKPEGKRPLGRPRRRWEDNIRMDLQEVGCGVWTGLGWLRIDRWRATVNAVMNLRVE
jgi:hypothetical protein